MGLQGIDVSNHKNIDVSIARDFVIVQTTWGVGGFDNDNLVNGISTIGASQLQRAKETGKLTGVMHYYMGNDVNSEARFFLDNNSQYLDESLIAIDWEAMNNQYFGNPDVFRSLLQAFTDTTGRVGLAYFQGSKYASLAPICRDLGWGIWVADYGLNSPTGILENTWDEGKYDCIMRQYGSKGQLGNGVDLDLDKFYGTAEDWNNWIGDADMATTVNIHGQQYPLDYALEYIVNALDAIGSADNIKNQIWYKTDTGKTEDMPLYTLRATFNLLNAVNTKLDSLSAQTGISSDELKTAVAEGVKTGIENIKTTVEVRK